MFGIPELLGLADVSTEGERFFGLLLSIVGTVSIRVFGRLLLQLASGDALQLLTAKRFLHPPMVLSPFRLFWALLLQELKALDDPSNTLLCLEELYSSFEDKVAKLSEDHQRWLLFFALPGALARHTEDAEAEKRMLRLDPLRCVTKQLPATSTLEASVGNMSFKATLYFPTDIARSGWAIFASDEDSALQVAELFEQHLEANRLRSTSSKGKGKTNSKSGRIQFQAPVGFTLGLRAGDLVSFKLEWPDFPHVPPLAQFPITSWILSAWWPQ